MLIIIIKLKKGSRPMNRDDVKLIINQEIMTTQQVADALEVSRAHVCNLARLGILHPLRQTRGGYLFYRDDIKKFIQAKEGKQNKD